MSVIKQRNNTRHDNSLFALLQARLLYYFQNKEMRTYLIKVNTLLTRIWLKIKLENESIIDKDSRK